MRKSQTFVSQDPDPISCKAPEESHNKARVVHRALLPGGWLWEQSHTEGVPVPHIHYQTAWP